MGNLLAYFKPLGALEPLCPGVPSFAQRSPELHEVFALYDVIRYGRSRERLLAIDALRRALARPSIRTSGRSRLTREDLLRRVRGVEESLRGKAPRFVFVGGVLGAVYPLPEFLSICPTGDVDVVVDGIVFGLSAVVACGGCEGDVPFDGSRGGASSGRAGG